MLRESMFRWLNHCFTQDKHYMHDSYFTFLA